MFLSFPGRPTIAEQLTRSHMSAALQPFANSDIASFAHVILRQAGFAPADIAAGLNDAMRWAKLARQVAQTRPAQKRSA